MKKQILLLLPFLLITLAACGQKKENKTTASSTIPSSSEVWNISDSEDSSTPVSKKLLFPKSSNGSQQTQIIRYQADKLLAITMEQTSPMNEDLKKAVAENGKEEAQNMLNESLEQDEEYKQAKALAGFAIHYEILNEQDIKITRMFDFQTFDIKKAGDNSFIQEDGLTSILKLKPKEYIENQKNSGAVEMKE